MRVLLCLLAVAFSALSLTGCVGTGSEYVYSEEGLNYKIAATANIQDNSESVDLEVYIVQGGALVKYIKFGKEGTDNTAALETKAGALEGTVNLGTETVRGLMKLPWMQ